MFIGIAFCREGVFFPTENALSAGKGGWECTARAKYAIYDCLAFYLQHVVQLSLLGTTVSGQVGLKFQQGGGNPEQVGVSSPSHPPL